MLRQKLQQVLKLSKEKWDDARDHAMRAVLADSRMRIWCARGGDRSTSVDLALSRSMPHSSCTCSCTGSLHMHPVSRRRNGVLARALCQATSCRHSSGPGLQLSLAARSWACPRVAALRLLLSGLNSAGRAC